MYFCGDIEAGLSGSVGRYLSICEWKYEPCQRFALKISTLGVPCDLDCTSLSALNGIADATRQKWLLTQRNSGSKGLQHADAYFSSHKVTKKHDEEHGEHAHISLHRER